MEITWESKTQIKSSCNPASKQNKQINQQVTRNTGLIATNQLALFLDDFWLEMSIVGKGEELQALFGPPYITPCTLYKKGGRRGTANAARANALSPSSTCQVGMWCLLYYVVTVANLAIGFCQTYGIRIVLSDCLFGWGFRIDVRANALSPSSTCQE